MLIWLSLHLSIFTYSHRLSSIVKKGKSFCEVAEILNQINANFHCFETKVFQYVSSFIRSEHIPYIINMQEQWYVLKNMMQI